MDVARALVPGTRARSLDTLQKLTRKPLILWARHLGEFLALTTGEAPSVTRVEAFCAPIDESSCFLAYLFPDGP